MTAQGAGVVCEEEDDMTKLIHAIYENGVFRPVEPVDLPEHTAVEIELRMHSDMSNGSQPPTRPAMSEGLARVYAVLGERYESGHADTAARHDEHQP
jgi:predicted DNA-binding antitoxin AbrB/MazE fold protein